MFNLLLRFLQLVGVTEEELKGVQRWNGEGVTQLLRQPGLGGGLLVTDPGEGPITT